jgi:hypothetical protein
MMHSRVLIVLLTLRGIVTLAPFHYGLTPKLLNPTLARISMKSFTLSHPCLSSCRDICNPITANADHPEARLPLVIVEEGL